jgi:PAS domain S-box-containing protein
MKNHDDDGLGGEPRFIAALVQQMDEAVVTVGLDHRVLTWSPGAERLFGWTAHEARTMPAYSLISDQPGPVQFEGFVQRLIAERHAIEELMLRRKDGTQVMTETTFVLLRDEDERPWGILGVARDVTTVQRSRELVFDEARLRGLSARMAEAELILTLEGQVVEVNERACVLHGRTRAELVRLNVRALRLRPGTGALATEARFETEHVRPDGSAFPVEVRSHAIEAGGRVYVQQLVRELSVERALRAALEKSEREVAELRAALGNVRRGAVLQPSARN